MTEEYITINDADINSDITNFLGPQNYFIDTNNIDNTPENMIDASGYINIEGNIVEKFVHNISYEQFKNLNVMLNNVEKEIFEQIKSQNLVENQNLDAKIYLMWWLSFILNTGWFLVNCEDNYEALYVNDNDYYDNTLILISVFEQPTIFNHLYETLNSNEYEWFNEFKKIINIHNITENKIKINNLILIILRSHLSNLYCYPYTLEAGEINTNTEYDEVILDTENEYQVPNNFTNKTDTELIENACIQIAANVLENITSSSSEHAMGILQKQPVTPVKIMSPEYLYSTPLTPQTPQNSFQQSNIFEIPLKKRKLYDDFYEENISPNIETKYKKEGLIQPTKTRKLTQARKIWGGGSKKLNKNKTNKKKIKKTKHMVHKTRRK